MKECFLERKVIDGCGEYGNDDVYPNSRHPQSAGISKTPQKLNP